MVNAQCTPNALCAALVCPDTAINLPHASASIPYNATMTVKVPSDTLITGLGTVTIDLLKFDSINGLPAGFTATPDVSAGWPGPSLGCLLISGTTTNAQAGNHPLVIHVTVKGMSGLLTLPLSLTGYKIVVDSSNGVSDYNLNKFSLSQNSPNPFSKTTTIIFNSAKSENLYFSVLNVIGEKVYEKNVIASIGENKIEFSAIDLPSGIYMYKLTNKTQTITRRMIVSEN